MSKHAQTMAALERAWTRSDWLFGLVGEDRWLSRGIELRHPFLFYVGHLPAFGWNQISAAIGARPHDAHLDVLFARGIDPSDEAEAESLRPDAWPSVAETCAYRDGVRDTIRGALPQIEARASDPVVGDVLALVLEHELMHHETLLYMIRQIPIARLHRPADWIPAVPGPDVAREQRTVAEGAVQLGAEPGAIEFGWDNEFPAAEATVPEFTIDAVPVTIGAFRRFVEDGGYGDDRHWGSDAAWRRASDLARPIAWREGPEGLVVRSMFAEHPIDEVAGWPVYVSLAEARAYSAWAGRRLPTEPELHRAAFTGPAGPVHDVPTGPGHDFRVHGRVPVSEGATSAWGVQDLIGNGWEWTSTPFLPRAGFEPIHPNYPGYSADFFDGEHFVVFGASWATDARLVRPSFRNWYQGRYPYVFSTFRTSCSRSASDEGQR